MHDAFLASEAHVHEFAEGGAAGVAATPAWLALGMGALGLAAATVTNHRIPGWVV